MQTYEIMVEGRSVKANSKNMSLVRTSVGVDRVHVLFDNDEWLGFPVTITFASANDMVSQTVTLTSMDSDKWAAEAYADVPWEVIDENGSVRVTLQGTDSSGNHIITAKGSPLTVIEAGDAMIGDVPSDAPTVDQWHQAYADALAAVNAAQSAVSDLQDRLDSIVAEAESSLDDTIGSAITPATTESLGVVRIGSGVSVDEDGVISVSIPSGGGMTEGQERQLSNLAILAYTCFDTSFDESGILDEGATVRRSALPVATDGLVGAVRPDGYSTTVDESGTLHATVYTLPLATEQSVGGVRPDGSTVLVSDGVISVPTATGAAIGLVRPDGTTISISEDGVLTATGGGGDGGYILPTASETQLGGVKVDGTTIAIQDGVISLALPNADDGRY